MNLSIIVAVSENHVIGLNNQLPWHLPADLRYFRRLTTGHTILMGRKTYESIGKPLPNRENVVITRDLHFRPEGVLVMHGLEQAIEHVRHRQEEVFIIGGDTIYRQSLSWVNRIYYTRVHVVLDEGTAFFPVLHPEEWRLLSSEYHARDEQNPHDYSFEIYERIHTDD